MACTSNLHNNCISWVFLTQIGVQTLMIESLPQVTVCILDQILYHGLLGSKLLFLEVALRLSIEDLLLSLQIFYGCRICSESCVPVALPRIYCDNLGVVHLAANPVMHSRTKHFELDLHFVRDKVLSRELVVVHLPAEFQVVDILTKAVSNPQFTIFRSKLKVSSASTMSLKGV